MVIYADITFINNFLMTLAIIWAVGHLLEFEIQWWGLIKAALIGTMYTFVVLFIQSYYLPGWLSLPLHIILNIITAVLMIKIAYELKNRKSFLKGIGYLYLVSFVTIGTTLSIFYINGNTPFKSGGITLFIFLGLIVLFLIGKYGWLIFQNYINTDIFYVPIEIIMSDTKLVLTGLVDTGNSLTDPLTRAPVIVVDYDEIIPIFPEKLQEKLLDKKGGIINLVNLFNENGLGNRVRILPFSDLGQEHGLLIGFRPDKVVINYKGREIETRRVIIAISENKLDTNNEYQVLVHPRILQFSI